MPMMRETASAASSSEETTKSTSRKRSRQTSRYSSLETRAIVLAFGARRRVSRQAIRLASSCEVQEMNRLASATPPCSSTRRLVPSPSTVDTP
jgi:ribosomal protein L20A (L18A)